MKKKRLNLLLTDDTSATIVFCVWGSKDLELPETSKLNPIVISVRNAKASEFGKHSVNSNDESEFIINPHS